VQVRIGDHFVKTRAAEGGDFLARLPALEDRGPYTLVVQTPETGERLEIKDLLAGEVWLASGQSNMEWTMDASRPVSDDDIAAANLPDIRFFTVPKRAEIGQHRSIDAQWHLASPETAGKFSAVAFNFARRLHEELGTPVGVISSSWGGTFIQAWISRSGLAHNPDVREWLETYEESAWSEKVWEQILSSEGERHPVGLPADQGNSGIESGWHLPNHDDSAWPELKVPGTWQSAGLWHSGVYWFRRALAIPSSWIGKELEVHLGAADKQDITYANGVEIGRTGKGFEDAYWNQPRVYRIPAALTAQPTISLAVRVYSFVYHGGLIGPSKTMRVHPVGDPSEAISLAGNWKYGCEQNFGLVNETHIMGHGEPNTPHILYDNMIEPLAPYALAGVIWYQGEANSTSFGIYAGLMRSWIRDWRYRWGQADLPFHIVQLTSFMEASDHQTDSQWARLREAQIEVLDEPHVGLAVTIDVGEAEDIHPKNKKPVGDRLAQSALVEVYNRSGEPRGPVFSGLVRDGNRVRCRFLYTGGALTSTDGAALRTFHIAGKNGAFVPAQASIDGDEVVVWSDEIPDPEAVRYAWANNPEGCNLASAQGSPASPFRSDIWD
jgi:sialate O-acetylesterase